MTPLQRVTTGRWRGIIALLVMLGAPSVGLAQPASPIVERDTCQGEGCGPGDKQANENIPVYASDSRSSQVVFWIRKDEQFQSLTTNLHHNPPGLAVLVRPFRPRTDTGDTVPMLQPGDSVVILSYRGEGFYTIVARGARYTAAAFWENRREYPLDLQPAARLVREAFTDEWVNVRNQRGQEGWVLWRKDLFYAVEK